MLSDVLRQGQEQRWRRQDCWHWRPEQLQQLRTALEQPAPRWEHIGIYNVAARLRLLDARCRVVVRSRPGRGTAVILYLPLVENEEEFEE